MINTAKMAVPVGSQYYSSYPDTNSTTNEWLSQQMDLVSQTSALTNPAGLQPFVTNSTGAGLADLCRSSDDQWFGGPSDAVAWRSVTPSRLQSFISPQSTQIKMPSPEIHMHDQIPAFENMWPEEPVNSGLEMLDHRHSNTWTQPTASPSVKSPESFASSSVRSRRMSADTEDSCDDSSYEETKSKQKGAAARRKRKPKEEARKAHAKVEQRYRENLNSKILQLKARLERSYLRCGGQFDGTADESSKVQRRYGDKALGKANVLSEAIRYIDETEVEMRHISQELIQLRSLLDLVLTKGDQRDIVGNIPC